MRPLLNGGTLGGREFMSPRKPYDESFRIAAVALELEGVPIPTVERLPRVDDEILGPSLFRTAAAAASLSELTLPGLFIGRSECSQIRLYDCDLRLASLCWNDFSSCVFDKSSMHGSDLRCSVFEDCSFVGTDLSGVDLRRATFKNCHFEHAIMTDLVANKDFRFMTVLSATQVAAIAWSTKKGPEPPGS